MASKLGVVAGAGELPARVIATSRAAGREVFVVALEGSTNPAVVEGVPHIWTRLGAVAGAIARLRTEGIQELVLAGSVTRPSLRALRPDAPTARLLARIGKEAFGDDRLLSAVVKVLEQEGFHVVGADDLLGDVLIPLGPLGALRPDDLARTDIARGIEVALALGRSDVGQAVIVQQGVVLGVEAVEGTDALIERCAALRREGPGGVLIKISKPGQERRVDLPTIGARTVEVAAAAGLRGLAVEAGAALVLDRETVGARADALGLFIVGIAVPC